MGIIGKNTSHFLARYAWWQGVVIKPDRKRYYRLRTGLRPARYPIASVRGGGSETWHFRGEPKTKMLSRKRKRYKSWRSLGSILWLSECIGSSVEKKLTKQKISKFRSSNGMVELPPVGRYSWFSWLSRSNVPRSLLGNDDREFLRGTSTQGVCLSPDFKEYIVHCCRKGRMYEKLFLLMGKKGTSHKQRGTGCTGNLDRRWYSRSWMDLTGCGHVHHQSLGRKQRATRGGLLHPTSGESWRVIQSFNFTHAQITHKRDGCILFYWRVSNKWDCPRGGGEQIRIHVSGRPSLEKES